MTLRVLYVLALSFGSACGAKSDAGPSVASAPDSHVISADFSAARLVARDTIAAGWATVGMSTATAEGHNLVAFRLEDGVSIDSFLAALDTAKGTPVGALALGGPEEAEPEVTMHLAPGRIVLACMLRDAQGQRHATHGEAQLVHVIALSAPADTGTAPSTTLTVSMTDFAYPGAETWPAGAHTITVANDGAADHLLLLTRLKPGKTLQDYMGRGGRKAGEYLGGLARMGPGRSASMRLDLQPGEYVLSCLVTDPRTGQQHIDLGMLKLVHVVADTGTTRD